MLDAEHILVLGRTGFGKTIFVRRHCFNAADVACSFVLDWNNRFCFDWHGRPLPLPKSYSYSQLNANLHTGWGIYDPSREFPGVILDKKLQMAALKHFCRYVRAASKGGPGRKLVCIAEVWNFCTEDSIPPEMAVLAQDGRGDRISFVFDTQRPELLNGSLVGAATEVVAFRLDEKHAKRAVGGMMGHDPEQICRLDKGQFVSRHLDGRSVIGRLF
ncbi:MAG: hypothetical protein QM813_09365 [Verrucomicrobiota bacterium]